MPFTSASAASVTCFVILVIGILASLTGGIYLANTKIKAPAKIRTFAFALGAVLWLTLLSMIVQSGYLAEAPMPRMMVFFGVINIATLALALSPVGGWLAAGIPLSLLVGFQGFRLPLELILHDWAKRGTIPMTMTWSGPNWDIFSGIIAIAAAPFARRNRRAAWLANVLGFILLLNVMRVAVFSAPLPFAWRVDPPLLLAFYLPYMWIVPVCVGGALFGHIVLTRALLRRR